MFGVDVLTEGVDVPEVDTILLLRPTESATVFLQQIGRGLRPLPTKACCTVLDFIGQQRREFRFDLRLRALTGTSRGALERQIQEGFPYLPTGCNLSLDRQATVIVLDNVRQALHLRKPELVRELQQLAATEGEPTLRRFLEHTGAELADLSRESIGGWVGLRAWQGCRHPPRDLTRNGWRERSGGGCTFPMRSGSGSAARSQTSQRRCESPVGGPSGSRPCCTSRCGRAMPIFRSRSTRDFAG